MQLRDEAAAIAGDMAGLRHAIHREPEIGLDLPETQRKVLAALDGLPLEVSTGRGLSSVTAVLRGGRGRRAGRAAARRHGRAAGHRGDRAALRIGHPRRDARLRPRPAHRHAGRRGAAAVGPPGRAARHRDLHVPARRGGLRRRAAHDRRGRPGRGGRAAGRGLRPARGGGPAAVRHVLDPAGRHAGRGRPVHRHGARAGRARLDAAPDGGPDPGRLRDGDRAADAGDQEVQRVRSGGDHGRQLPRRDHRQRDPGRGQVPGPPPAPSARTRAACWPRWCRS